jgi:hypothetical protein
MPRFSPNYKRTKHPLIIRLIALWRVMTCKNFILIDYSEFIKDGKKGRKIRPLYRTNYDAESEQLTLKAAFLMRSQNEA